MNLSTDQRRAVERTGQDVCVVAGPGSGKTRVLTERFAWLVEQQGIDPARILAITFTEKAATEIKQRVVKRFAQRPELRESIERSWVQTIDGFCTRLLREHSIAAGLAPDFAILDQGLADRLLRGATEEALDELYRERPEDVRRLLEALDLSTQDDGRQPDLAQSLIEVYRRMRTSGLTEPPRNPVRESGDFATSVRAIANEILRDPTPGKTPNQREAIPALRQWASAFRDLPEAPLTRDHFAALAFKFNTGHFPAGTPLRENANRLKNELLPDLESQWLGEWYAHLHDLLREALARIAQTYDSAKRAESGVDFADLVELTVRLLEAHPDIRQETAARFDQILMDELQDTNRLQWRLVDLIRRSFFGVGDINQSIYSFRFAEPEVFREYRDTLASSGAAIDELLENYRSRPEILAAVSSALGQVPGIEPRELIARGAFDDTPTSVVERIVAQGEQAQEIEAALVATRIRELCDDGGCAFEDIAVLVRTLNASEPFQRAFDRFQIPFLISGGKTFLEARETKDLMALLAALANPLDEIALVGAMRSPLAGLSDEEIFRMGNDGRQTWFEERFGEVRRAAGFVAPDQLIAKILDACAYTAGLPERAQANVDKFLALLRREYRRRPRPLAELLADVEALRAMQSEAEAPPPDAAGAVRLMSIHAAKGLEFPVVFVSALHRSAENRKPILIFSSEQGLGARWRNPLTAKGQSDSIHKRLWDEERTRVEEEESRLLYVAMTRAEKRLYVSYAERKRPSVWQTLVTAAIPNEHVAAELPAAPMRVFRAGQVGPGEIPLDPPIVTDQYDSSVTATALAQFAACPRKYRLHQQQVTTEATAPGTGAIEFGLAVHKALAGGRVDDPQANEFAERFRKSELGQRAARAVRIEREFDFAIEVEDVIVSGQIDLWFEEGGELVIVDYKTDRDTSSQSAYATQLRLYARALERYAARPADRAYLYYLRPNEAVEIGLDSLEPARLIEKLKGAQQSRDFAMQPGPQCLRCEYYKGVCPAPPL